MNEFEYLLPKTFEEAISLTSKHGRDAKVLAGGTDLLVLLSKRKLMPKYVINISRIRGLGFLEYDEKTGLRMGAMCTLRAIETSVDVKENYPVLVDAVKAMASVQIRNMASIGGNLCNASPAADTVPPLLVLNAQVKIAGSNGERSVPLDGFFLGPGKTVIQPGEMLTEINLPNLPSGTAAAFVKIGRTPTDISKVSVAVLLTMKDEICQEVRIALGSVGPTPMRARRAEDVLRGKHVTDELIQRTAFTASEEAKPITDIRSTAAWRKQVTGHLVKSLLADNFKRVSS
jgi:carbon-monoxide dehydrogenase medium subunit